MERTLSTVIAETTSKLAWTICWTAWMMTWRQFQNTATKCRAIINSSCKTVQLREQLPGRGKTCGDPKSIVTRAIWISWKSFATISTIGWKTATSLQWTSKNIRKKFTKRRARRMRWRIRYIRWPRINRFPWIIIRISHEKQYSTIRENSRVGSLITWVLIRVRWSIKDTTHTKCTMIWHN